MRNFDKEGIIKEFNQLFNGAGCTMFKAEVLQDYSAIDDSPAEIERVHIVKQPYTDYLQ